MTATSFEDCSFCVSVFLQAEPFMWAILLRAVSFVLVSVCRLSLL